MFPFQLKIWFKYIICINLNSCYCGFSTLRDQLARMSWLHRLSHSSPPLILIARFTSFSRNYGNRTPWRLRWDAYHCHLNPKESNAEIAQWKHCSRWAQPRRSCSLQLRISQQHSSSKRWSFSCHPPSTPTSTQSRPCLPQNPGRACWRHWHPWNTQWQYHIWVPFPQSHRRQAQDPVAEPYQRILQLCCCGKSSKTDKGVPGHLQVNGTG